MENKFLSLLYPSEESRNFHQLSDHLPDISEEVCEQLGLTEILPLRSCSMTEFFTSSPEVIKFRQETLSDMAEIPELKKTLSAVQPILSDIRELRALDKPGDSPADSYLYSITEIELYVSCIQTLSDGLLPVRDRLHSRAFIELCDFIREVGESEYYSNLNKKLSALAAKVHEVRSVTVGVNLDGQFRPSSAGIISINSQQFKSGKLLDKILRLSFRNDSFTTIAELVPFEKNQSENRKEALAGAFNSAIEDVLSSSVKGWRAVVGEYVMENTDFLLRLLPEIEFAVKGSDLAASLAARSGCSVCIPRIMPWQDKAFRAKELYNPRVALAISGETVTNDLEFDDNGRIYVLTGPNRGGKSVITVALGAAQAMFQLGLPVPAADAEISPVDGIFTHFPEGADDTIDKGRLGEECARLREIFDQVTENSLILLDESLSSTGAYEATYIASEILCGFAVIGCRGIFSTHLHDLAAAVPEINEKSRRYGGVMTDTLVAGIESGKRSFKIYRAKPDGKSYAKDIADKYGLSFDALSEKLAKKPRML